MAAGARLAALVALLVGLHVPCAAQDDEEPPVDIEKMMAESEGEDGSDYPGFKFEEEDEKLMEAARRGRPVTTPEGKKFPFLEYTGYLEEEDDRSNIHVATMSLEEAKMWCAEHENCAGFTHAGEPTEEKGTEFYFESTWKLAVDRDDPWTSYQRGTQMKLWASEEKKLKKKKEKEDHAAFHCEIQTCSG